MTAVDLLVTVALLCLLAGISVPTVLSVVNRSRGRAAARYLAARMAVARGQAVGRSTTVSLRFDASADGTRISTVQDGNRNGVRTEDIDTGIDRVIEAPVLLDELFPGVSIGVSQPALTTTPVQASGTDILSFTSLGTATSGTIYLRDRDDTQWAVRVLGATARTRVLRYDTVQGDWLRAD